MGDDLVAKLSKKISELTLVVHKLFKSKTELELYVENLKTNFQNFIENKEKKFEDRVEFLEKQLKSSESNVIDLKTSKDDREQLFQKISHLEETLSQTRGLLLLKDESLDQYRQENQLLNTRINTLNGEISTFESNSLQTEVDKLNSKLAETENRANKMMEKYEKKIKVLNEHFDIMEKQNIININELNNENMDLKRFITAESKRFEKLIEQEKEKTDRLNKNKRKLMGDIRMVELENQRLGKELEELKEQINTAKKQNMDNLKMVPDAPMDAQILFLRKELHRYQLELLNRENNYNRLFSNRQAPIRGACATKYDLTGTKVRQIVQTSYLPDLPHSPVARYTSYNTSN